MADRRFKSVLVHPEHGHVVVSSVDLWNGAGAALVALIDACRQGPIPGRFETMVFVGNADGEIVDFLELDRANTNDAEALATQHEAMVAKWAVHHG